MIADIHLLLEPDTIVSSQLFATVRRQAPTKQGEYRLLLAVLEDAINCFQENAHATDKSKQRLFAEVQGWITGEGGDTVDRLRARPRILLRVRVRCIGSRCCLSTLGLAAVAHAWRRSRRSIVKALVYQGPGKKALDDRPVPEITAPTDAIVKITKTTICGTDLHILKGDVPTCDPGRILGHEGVGVVEKTGPGVTAFRPGDHVLISCISACGKCEYCRKGMYSHCTTGGWILGNRIDGTQAEYVRIPYADTSLYKIPPASTKRRW